MGRFAPPPITVATVVLLMCSGSARAQTAWYEGFEGPEPSWRVAGSDAQYRLERQQRLQGGAHTGDGFERLTVVGTGGTYVYAGHQVGQPRVIADLLLSVWVKANRAGLQMAAQVVLPRTNDPRTGRPVSTILRGSSYTNVGHWEQLRVNDLPQLLARQVRVLRTQIGPSVDGHGAYVERVLLNVYGGPGVTDVCVDDLDVAGYVASTVDAVQEPARPVGGGSAAEAIGGAGTGRALQHRVVLKGSGLTVDDQPMFPRAIFHQGEPLSFLKQLGFNAVWLGAPASTEMLAEAERLDLWLICPPPRSTSPYLRPDAIGAIPEIGPEYDRVLVWDMGRGLTREQLAATESWTEQVRLADRRQNRPLICLPVSDLRGYSRHFNSLLLIDRQPLGTSLELADYGNWVRRQPLLARPGTTIWTAIQTQPSAALGQQLVALQPDRAPPSSVCVDQLRLLAYTAISAGSRGLLLMSQSPLSANDPETRYRAMSLELLNLELQVIEPWTAAGSVLTTVVGSESQVTGTLLRTERARLLLPIWLTPGAQYVPGQSGASGLSLVVPGVPDSSLAYELNLGGLQPLRHKRVTGGMRLTFDEFNLLGEVLLAQDPLVIDAISRRASQIGPRGAELHRHLSVHRLSAAEQVVGQLGGVAAIREVPSWLDAARKSLQYCDGYLAAKQYPMAVRQAERAMQALRLVERAHWEAAVKTLASPISSPAAVSFSTLPDHGRLTARIAASRSSPSLIRGGDFEDLQAMLSSGWKHSQYPTAKVRSSADLVPEAAHSGQFGLRLVAQAEDTKSAPAVIETAPAWITSPPVAVEAGQLLCIRGWVLIPAPITASVDGLMIFDSFSGEPLAERIGQTTGWRQFVLYRAAPSSGQMTVTLALTGLGEVRLDDVTIERLDPPGLSPMAQAGPMGGGAR